jgi:type VI secretion system secreted protein VgrG
MDIHAGIIAMALLAVIFAYFSVRGGLRTIRSARKMTFYRLRRQREAGGWRLLGLAIILLAFAVWMPLYGEPIAYQYFPPSPTPSPTPTITVIPSITVSPTITLTPTITDTPAVSATPTITSTPFLPLGFIAGFQSSITPNPDTVFSPLVFSTTMDNSQAINPNTVFQNPVGHMFGVFSYDKMAIGAQWTALWLHEGQIVHYETKPWNCDTCGTGGFGFTDWNPAPQDWASGIYEVQIFVGEEWKVVGRFLVLGEPPTAIPTLTPTLTRTPRPAATPTTTPSKTPGPSGTPPLPDTTPSPTGTP